ncbi:LCP family protein [Phycicoccus endophyticus]|uniref:LCP family protein n=1 Tax=Phycicoccus endophyticus TaxID=1690220 RepID=A0A7G9R5K7_9MICO|nr:LCP family protein [Phycicoccus endophyticus]QNN50882.1 LCP family protein [Phycicoccus endophyticus]
MAVAVVAVLAVGGGAGLLAAWRLNANITKVDVSDAIGTDRPTQAAPDAVNILLVGSDTRKGKGNNEIGMSPDDPGDHSDTNLLVHLSEDRTWASVVSIPRDSMTPAPPECSSDAPKTQWVTRQWNHNYQIGGIGCLIRTLEGNTGVYVDHYAVVDFRGFQDMVDALGGVEVCTEEAIDDEDSGLQLSAGTHTLQGEQALAYVRVRKSVGDGSDLGRIKRQQAFLSSVAQEATSSRLLFRPTALYGFLDAATRSLTTDPDFGLGTMRDLAESVREIGLENIEFVTVPNETYPADPNRVQWQDSAEVIWESLREDHRVNEPAATRSPSPSPSASALSVSPDDIDVLVLNASGTSGLAGQSAAALTVQGFASVQVGDASGEVEDGVLVEYSAGQAQAARTVAAAFPGATVRKAEGLGETVRVTLGPGSPAVVEVPNRLGSEPLPDQPVTATEPSPQPTISTRPANESICSTS